MYDVASSKSPLPCLQLGDYRTPNASVTRSEGVSAMRFLSTLSKSSSSTSLLTGGTYGTVRVWTIPKVRQQSISSLNAKCLWSISVFGTRGEGVCDMMVLPFSTTPNSNPDINMVNERKMSSKPAVLLAGNAASLVLLDTNKCTRKAFSTTVTPTILASWDLYRLISRELAAIDSEAKLPARRWMAVQRMNMVGCGFSNGISWYKIGVVVKSGWVFAVEVNTSSNTSSATPTINIHLHILHRTSRVQCFNSSNERITTLGGMALHHSLPDIPVPSTHPFHAMENMIWVGDVMTSKYTMPSKDKYTLSNVDFTIITPETLSLPKTNSAVNEQLRQPGGGLILLNLCTPFESPPLNKPRTSREGESNASTSDGHENARIVARLPLSHGTPVSLAVHPSGEWMVVGYGMDGRGMSTKSLELVSLKKVF